MSRWAPLSGLVFVALWIVAFVVGLGGEESPSDAVIVAHYADQGNRSSDVTFFFLVVLASLVFVAFLSVLRGRLAETGGRDGALPVLAFGAGIAAATLWVVAGVFWGSVAYTANETEAFRVDPNTERLVGEVAYLFFVTGIVSALLVVLATSVVALRTGVLPRWLAWLGLPVAVTMLGALAVLPFFFFLVWVALVSASLVVRDRQLAVGSAPTGEAA